MILTIYYKPFNVENKTDVAVWLMTMVVVGGTGGLAGGLGGGQTVLCRMFSLRFSLLTTALIVYLARYFTFDCCFSTADVMRGGCQLAPQLQPQTQFFCRCYLWVGVLIFGKRTRNKADIAPQQQELLLTMQKPSVWHSCLSKTAPLNSCLHYIQCNWNKLAFCW